MVKQGNVTYYSVDEITVRPGNTLTADTINAFLRANPTYGLKIDGVWFSYDLAIGYMNRGGQPANHFLAGALGFDFTALSLRGKVLDIGAGGEGIIGQVAGDRAVGIAPEEHRSGLEKAPGCGLKIMMDARDMKFLDNTFDTVTAFFTLMYIDCADHHKVFNEAYRVLKPGGEFLLWDMAIPADAMDGKSVFVMGIEVQLRDRVVQTGYGAGWAGKTQNMPWFLGLARNAGFRVLDTVQDGYMLYLKLGK